jgi:tetratricopeptide (TPR) repeat protein
MRVFRLFLPLLGALLLGCGGQTRVQVDHKDDRPAVSDPKPSGDPNSDEKGSYKGDGNNANSGAPDLSVPAPALSKDEKYNAALLNAITSLSDRKFAEALTALESARAISDTEQVRNEIDKVKRLMEDDRAAEQTKRDIQTVLNDGKADDAAKLAGSGLATFGGGDRAEEIAQLKREADAVAVAPLDAATRQARFLQEGDQAYRDKNLRAAAIAYDQVLQQGDDPVVRARLEEVRTSISRYDDGRRRAAELRRDPSRLEDALAALNDAVRAWDTVQVRQEIDDCQLALQRRRDRIAVADFEVRGDIGVPFAGRVLAEELLPYFKPKFDLVERTQLRSVLDELRLEGSEIADRDEARQEVGRLAKVRYLVVGSVTPFNGLSVNARLIEVKTGLVVQTAKFIANDPKDLMRRMQSVAAVLMMSDEQKIALEAELARRDQVEIKPVVLAAALPPPPPIPDPNVVVAAPPALVIWTPRPAPVGGLVIEDFGRIPPPPPEPPPFALDVLIVKDNPLRQRMLQLNIEIGDNLFRRGHYKEAHRHFELAFSLSNRNVDIGVRVDRCRELLPPPPPSPVVVIGAPPPLPVVVVVRPRIAIFNFLIDAPPGLVPIGCDNWVADQLAACYAPTHEIIDRGEVCWWMGRLGITMRDVLNDPASRVALAQALNARFFVFGGMKHTASFDVTTTMIDAQNGGKTGGGAIHVQDHNEMKMRLPELVRQTLGTKEQATEIAKQGADSEKVIADARKLLQAGRYAEANQAASAGLVKYPTSTALKSIQAEAEKQAQKDRLEEARRQEQERQAATAAAAKKRQDELASQADEARKKAEAEAKARDQAAVRARDAERLRAHDDLIARARTAAKAGNSGQAVTLYESAIALKPDDADYRELAQVKLKSEEAAKAAGAENAKLKADAEARAKAAQVAEARVKVEAERKQREAADAEKVKQQEARDTAEQNRLIAHGNDLMKKGDYATAASVFQSAGRIKKSAEVDKLIAQANDAVARADADKKGQQAKADLEKKLVAEKAAREKADAEAKQKQDAYQKYLSEAQKAFAEKRYDAALASYDAAGKLFRTDTVLAGQKQVADAKAHDAAQLAADKHKQEEEQARQANLTRLLKDGQAALDAKQYDKAISLLGEAKKLAPTSVDVQAALSKAQLARDNAIKAESAAEAEKKRQADYARLVKDGRDALTAKKYDDAIKSFGDALKVQPGDRDATALLQAAVKGRDDTRAANDAEAKRKADFNRLMTSGQAAVTAKKYDEAIRDFGDALKLMPGDPGATKALKDAQVARDAPKPPPPPPAEYVRSMDQAAALEKAQKYADAALAYSAALKALPGDAKATQSHDFAQHMADGQKLLNAKKFPDAVKEFEQALKVFPTNKDAQDFLKKAKDGKP